MGEVYGIEDMKVEDREQMIDNIKALGVELEETEIRQIKGNPDFALSHSLMAKLDNRRVRIRDHFYTEKAKELFLKAGFLTLPKTLN